MVSPFRFQEVLAAAFHFGTTETVEEVNARHEREDDEAEKRAEERRKRKGRGRSSIRPTAVQPDGEKPPPPPSGALAELQAFIDNAAKVRSQMQDAAAE